MHYQPQVDAQDCTRSAGFEALMRWEHPERGPISPPVFIPIAEESNLIDQLGRMGAASGLAMMRQTGRAN